MTKENKPKRVFLGGTWFTLPFCARGWYVQDATAKEVAEAKTLELAKALAEMLNKEYAK